MAWRRDRKIRFSLKNSGRPKHPQCIRFVIFADAKNQICRIWSWCRLIGFVYFLLQAEDGIRDWSVTGVQTCALPIWPILLQMGPDFAPDELPALERFVPTLPDDLRFAIELRRKEWMGSDVLPHLLELLARHKIGRASCRERV